MGTHLGGAALIRHVKSAAPSSRMVLQHEGLEYVATRIDDGSGPLSRHYAPRLELLRYRVVGAHGDSRTIEFIHRTCDDRRDNTGGVPEAGSDPDTGPS
jgi:hypothetical protein